MKRHWEKLVEKIDGISLRERVLIFAAVAFMLVALIQVLFLDPLLAEQKRLSVQVVQQQEMMKDIQAQIGALLQARRDDAASPLRQRLSQVKQQLADGNAYLQSSREHLVHPEKMADLLEQVLKKNGRLQLVSLQTLPAAPLIEKAAKPDGAGAQPVSTTAEPDGQIFKHGVQITVHGSYLDMLQYLAALEQLPTKMFWGMSRMNVVQYPTAELTLTLYTLSLNKTWLQI